MSTAALNFVANGLNACCLGFAVSPSSGTLHTTRFRLFAVLPSSGALRETTFRLFAVSLSSGALYTIRFTLFWPLLLLVCCTQSNSDSSGLYFWCVVHNQVQTHLVSLSSAALYTTRFRPFWSPQAHTRKFNELKGGKKSLNLDMCNATGAAESNIGVTVPKRRKKKKNC